MNFFARFEGRVGDWQSQRASKKRLETLGDAIIECNRLLGARDDSISANAKQHIDCADRNHRQAMISFKEEDYDECNEFIDKGEIHVHFAHACLSVGDAVQFDPGFSESSVERLIEHLSESISRTKMAVEYSNCVVSPRMGKGLITVVALFNAALDKLTRMQADRARHIADAGLLLLYALTRLIEAENARPLAEIKLSKAGTKMDKSIKALADQLADCKRMFAESSLVIPDRAQIHFADAEHHLYTSIDSLVDNDPDAVEAAAQAGLIELKLAQKIFRTTDPQMEQPLKEPASEEPDMRAIYRRIEANIELVKCSDRDQLQKHLKAALKFYERAVSAQRSSVWNEVDRLAKAAWLDLDFAQQIAFSKQKPRYRDI
jgi:hypothetical protein